MIYIAACNNTVNDFLRSNLGVIGGVGIAFGLFQVSSTLQYCAGKLAK